MQKMIFYFLNDLALEDEVDNLEEISEHGMCGNIPMRDFAKFTFCYKCVNEEDVKGQKKIISKLNNFERFIEEDELPKELVEEKWRLYYLYSNKK